jgi:hypothetical protein
MTDLEACQQLLMQLLRRKPVAAHELKRALGEEHWEDYEGRLERVKEWREEAMIASYELRDYVRMLRIADLHDAPQTKSADICANAHCVGRVLPQNTNGPWSTCRNESRKTCLSRIILIELSRRIAGTTVQISVPIKRASRVCGIRKTRCHSSRRARSRRIGSSRWRRWKELSKRCQALRRLRGSAS